MRIPDAYLNFWADVYIAQRLSDQGVALEPFVRNPELFLSERQLAHEQQRLEEGPTTVRDGALIEKLTHAGRDRAPVCIRLRNR